MRQVSLFLLVLISFVLLLPVSVLATDDEQAVIDVIERVYVDGLWRQRDVEIMRTGFHPTFVMQNLEEGQVSSTTLEQWIEWIGPPGKPNPKKVEAEIKVLDIEGDVASARVKLSEDGAPRFTDFFALYRTKDGWQIVAKTYQGH